MKPTDPPGKVGPPTAASPQSPDESNLTAENIAYLAELEQSNQALQEFASIASHEMQEPLRKVRLFGTRLKDEFSATLGVEGKDCLERMLRATERMEALLLDLLKYSRITTRVEPLRKVKLSTIVYEVISDLEARIEETRGRVEVGELPVIDADSRQMRDLFQNLIGNALKYHGEESPVVKIYAVVLDEKCVIHVEDNGIGFDEKYLKRLFQPFQRLHGRVSHYEGTGMGLAICQKIVQRHHGSITARSAPGKGATFIVTLPLHKES